MAAQTIYMMNGRGPDPAILRGLAEAGCSVRDTHSVGETLNSLRASSPHANPTLLIAEVQAGALTLLTLLRESGLRPPPTLLFDQEGTNLQSVITALQLGVQEYVLASESAIQRELRARVLAERVLSAQGAQPKASPTPPITPAGPVPADTKMAPINFQWDVESHVIYVEDKYLRLCPVEGRIFDLLVKKHNQVVSMEELIAVGLRKTGGALEEGIKLVRPHMMRLRNKLERHPTLAHRVINVRGNGYMFI